MVAIKQELCRVVECDGCQAVLKGDGYIMHFLPIDEMDVRNYDWHVDAKGFVRCGACISSLSEEEKDDYGWPKDD